MEYYRMARQKRKRLAAGKGVKKNGVYLKGDQAASFESLPNGPDPSSIHRDIHDLIPKLTKKGTLFRASQATIDQRHQELQACINALFQDDVPALIQELRENRKVTDFFGYWRRDFDLAMKHRKNPEKHPRNSISSSIFNQYFSASSTNLAASDSQSSVPSRARSSSMPLASPGAGVAPSPREPTSAPNRFILRTSDLSSSDEEFCHGHSQGSRRGSEASNTSSAEPPSPPATPLADASPYIVVHENPVVFDHNPASGRGLQPLPEDEEFSSSLSAMTLSDQVDPAVPSRRQPKAHDPEHRKAHVFEEEHMVDAQLNRLSWQTTTSTATTNPASYLADLDTDLTLPKSEDDVSRFPRMSVASFATFMTDSSADAINPLSSRLGYRRSHSVESRRSTSQSTFGQSWSDGEDDEAGNAALLDAFFNGMCIFYCSSWRNFNIISIAAFPSAVPEDCLETPVAEVPSSIQSYATGTMVGQPSPAAVELSFTDEFVCSPSLVLENFPGTPLTELPYLRPETPVGELPSNASLYSSLSGHSHRTFRTFHTSTTSRTSIATGTTSDTSSIMEANGQISVKVVHNHSIILLRIHRATSFEEMRSKIYDKFVHQENAPLSESFGLAYLPPLPFDHRARSGSTGFPELAHMRFVSSQSEWDRVLASAGRGKLTLRAIGDRGI